MSDTAVNVVAIWANDGELLTKAATEIERLRAALNKISKLNARRDRYSQEVEDVIIAALGEKE